MYHRIRTWRHAACGLAALVMSAAAWSAAPTDASIEELLEFTQGEKMIDLMLGDVEKSVLQGAKAGMGDRQPTPREQRILEAVARTTSEVLREEVTWAKLKPVMLEVYRDSFTQEEVDGQIAFYRSPVGQSVSAKMPATMRRSMAASDQLLQPVMPRLMQAIQRTVAEIKQKEQGTEPPPAKPQ
jgi:hypothetical protein